MNILLAAATEHEIALLRKINCKHSLSFLVTGIGMISTTYSLTKYFTSTKPDLAINCGIAGSFKRDINIGEMVRVQEDILAEFGAEDDLKILSPDEINLDAEFIFHDTFDHESLNKIKQVKSITVNRVHGNENSIKNILARLNPDTESMEGAAFFFVCKKENIPSIQLRTISNFVEKRNKNAWNIPLAIENLTNEIKKILNEI